MAMVRVESHDKDGVVMLPKDVVAVLGLMNCVIITHSQAMPGKFIDVYPWYEVDENGERTVRESIDPLYYMNEKETVGDAVDEITRWVHDGCPKRT